MFTTTATTVQITLKTSAVTNTDGETIEYDIAMGDMSAFIDNATDSSEEESDDEEMEESDVESDEESHGSFMEEE